MDLKGSWMESKESPLCISLQIIENRVSLKYHKKGYFSESKSASSSQEQVQNQIFFQLEHLEVYKDWFKRVLNEIQGIPPMY